MLLTNETVRPIVISFEHGDHIVVQPFRTCNRTAMEQAFGRIKSVRFKKDEQ